MYPTVKDRSTEKTSEEAVRCRNRNSDIPYADGYDVVFVSINRYERKKNIELALDALHHFNASKNSISTALVIAGGYDYSVVENAEYLTELKDHCRRLKLPYTHTQDAVDDTPASSTSISFASEVESCRKMVIFRTSVSGQEREALLARADALLYTPDRCSAINDSLYSIQPIMRVFMKLGLHLFLTHAVFLPPTCSILTAMRYVSNYSQNLKLTSYHY